MFFSEDTFEKAVLQIFEGLGYTHLYGPDLERDYSSSAFVVLIPIPLAAHR